MGIREDLKDLGLSDDEIDRVLLNRDEKASDDALRGPKNPDTDPDSMDWDGV
jgi:hypothetical protein